MPAVPVGIVLRDVKWVPPAREEFQIVGKRSLWETGLLFDLGVTFRGGALRWVEILPRRLLCDDGRAVGGAESTRLYPLRAS